MSRIYFHSENGTAEVSGRERAHFSNTCASLAESMLYVSFHDDPIKRLLPSDSYLLDLKGYDWVRPFNTWFRLGQGDFVVGEERWPIFDVALNTVLAIGNEALRLMARIHGQCEIHGYIDGHDRAWLANVIAEARALKLFRDGMGWESVITLLRSTPSGAVVMSYSVCQGFPNPDVAEWKDDEEGEAFWRLPAAERWALAMAVARENCPRLQPDDFAAYRFMNGKTAMDVRAVADALPVSPSGAGDGRATDVAPR